MCRWSGPVGLREQAGAFAFSGLTCRGDPGQAGLAFEMVFHRCTSPSPFEAQSKTKRNRRGVSSVTFRLYTSSNCFMFAAPKGLKAASR